MKKYFILMIFFASIISFSAHALNYGCSLKNPAQISKKATELTEKFNNQGKSFPDSLTLSVKLKGKINSFDDNNKNEMQSTIEGFYRPKINAHYSLLPIPLFVVELTRARHILYICAHLDEDPKKTHVTIYTLYGYNIDPANSSNFIGDAFMSPQLTVQSVGVSLIDFHEVRKNFFFWIDWLPPVKLIFETIIAGQRLLTTAVTDLSNIGVERITITKEHIELAGDIDNDNPDDPGFIKIINYDSESKESSPE